MSETELSDELRRFVEASCGAPVAAAVRHVAGASREAWRIDLAHEPARAESALFLLRDKRRAGSQSSGCARDAAVLRALHATPVPVPRLVAHDERLAAVLLARLPGRSDFPPVDAPEQCEPVARHLMQLTAALHAIEPTSLEIAHLALPESAEACALGQLAPAEQALHRMGVAVDPLFRFALGWLKRNVPREIGRVALVHSDMGPGNFLFEGGKVTGIVDWEVAHFGDPMEDLAAVAVRDMATPVGDLSRRFAEYAEAGGAPLDLERIGYYRALVLTRNAMLITLGLAHPPPGYDVAGMTAYQILLMRAAALVLCDALGVPRPVGSAPAGSEAPADSAAAAECDDLCALMGRLPGDSAAALTAFDELLAAREGGAAGPDEPDDAMIAAYLARRMLRVADGQRELLGDLFERYPQRLEPR